MEQREASKDAVMTRIGQAVMLLHGGDREEARNRFGVLWAEIGECGGALHRCTLAHYMADTQDDPEDELAWDLCALASAQGLTGGGATDAGTAPGAGARGGEGALSTGTRSRCGPSFRPCTSPSRRTTSGSGGSRRPGRIWTGAGKPWARSTTTVTGTGCARPWGGWSGGCGGVAPDTDRAGPQTPVAPSIRSRTRSA